MALRNGARAGRPLRIISKANSLGAVPARLAQIGAWTRQDGRRARDRLCRVIHWLRWTGRAAPTPVDDRRPILESICWASEQATTRSTCRRCMLA